MHHSKKVDFSQVIHIFFSSLKKVNHLKKICAPLETGLVLFRHAAFSPTSL